MKKALVAAILGIALNVTSSHAQGYIVMENYKVVGATPVFSGITYGTLGTGALAGEFVGSASGFKVDLLYSLDGGTTYSLAAGSQTAIYGPSVDGGTPTTDGAGSFLGPTVTIPGYTSGSVMFEVEAYNGSTYANTPGNGYRGISNPFSISSLVTSTLQTPGDLLQLSGTTPTGLQSFVVNQVPEPSIFALAGLSAAGLMVLRRKK